MTRTDETWKVHPLRSARRFKAGGGWVAVAPGCTAVPHPHRWCECRIFATAELARAYVSDQHGNESESALREAG